MSDLAIAGLTCKVLSAKFLRSGVAIEFKQDKLRTHLLGLPMDAPDAPMTTIAIECDGEPMQDTENGADGSFAGEGRDLSRLVAV